MACRTKDKTPEEEFKFVETLCANVELQFAVVVVVVEETRETEDRTNVRGSDKSGDCLEVVPCCCRKMHRRHWMLRLRMGVKFCRIILSMCV